MHAVSFHLQNYARRPRLWAATVLGAAVSQAPGVTVNTSGRYRSLGANPARGVSLCGAARGQISTKFLHKTNEATRGANATRRDYASKRAGMVVTPAKHLEARA